MSFFLKDLIDSVNIKKTVPPKKRNCPKANFRFALRRMRTVIGNLLKRRLNAGYSFMISPSLVSSLAIFTSLSCGFKSPKISILSSISLPFLMSTLVALWFTTFTT